MSDYRSKDIRVLAAAALYRHFLPGLARDEICHALGVSRDEYRIAEERLFGPERDARIAQSVEEARTARLAAEKGGDRPS